MLADVREKLGGSANEGGGTRRGGSRGGGTQLQQFVHLHVECCLEKRFPPRRNECVASRHVVNETKTKTTKR